MGVVGHTVLAPAKVNLSLVVLERDSTGRHPLKTVMLALDLCDELSFRAERSADPRIRIEMSFPDGEPGASIPSEDNLIARGFAAFREEAGIKPAHRIDVRARKRIPVQGGLGGGSSDCAAAIAFAAELAGVDPRGDAAMAAARRVGSDVAFFLHGGCCALGGYGDVLEKALPVPELDIVLARPRSGCPTPEVYRAFDGMAVDDEEGARARREGLLRRHGELVGLLAGGACARDVASSIGNGLTSAACAVQPEVGQALADISAQGGVLAAEVSGSGSAVFAVCDCAESARAAADAMRGAGYWSCVGVPFS